MNRRSFFTRSAVGLGGLQLGARNFRWPEFGRQSRPALSEVTLTRYVQGIRSRGDAAVDGLLREVSTDVRSFFRNRFALASEQEAFVSRFVDGDIRNILTAFERGLVGRNEFQVRIPAPNPAGKGCRLRLEREFRQVESGIFIENWSLVVENQ